MTAPLRAPAEIPCAACGRLFPRTYNARIYCSESCVQAGKIAATRAWRKRQAEPESARLDIYQDTAGSCMRVSNCQRSECRHNFLGDTEGNANARRIPVLQDTCAIKLANAGNWKLDEVGDHLGITRERARQLEAQALTKLRRVLQFSRREIVEALRHLSNQQSVDEDCGPPPG